MRGGGKYHALLITATLSLFLVLPFILTACGGGGGGSTTSADTTTTAVTTTNTIAITGSLSSAASKPSSGKSAQQRAISSWAGATLQVIDSTGTVVGTGTVNADGTYSVSVLPGSNYFIRVQIGNLVLKAFIPSVSAAISVNVNTTTTAEVMVLATVLDVANLGDSLVDASTALAAVNITTVMTEIDANASLSTVASTLATEIANSYDSTATTPTLGSVSSTVTGTATAIGATVSGSAVSISAGSNQALLSGTLTSASNISVTEVANANVYIIGQEANGVITDANGNYALVVDTSKISVVTQKPFAIDSLYTAIKYALTRAPAAASNVYGIVAHSSSKLHGKKFEVTVNDGDTLTGQSASIDKVGSITGSAKLQGQSDHTGIMVYIPGTSFLALTDSGGSYTISNVPSGTYPFLRAEKSGYKYAMLASVVVNSNAATAAADMQLLLDTGASGSIVIGTGASYITNRSTTFSIGATASAVLMKISEDSLFVGVSWEALQTTKAYTFASDGAKTIYIKFADANGLESSPFTASVLVDTAAPTVTSTSPADLAPNVTTNSVLSVTFSEAMDATTLTGSTMTLDNSATCTVTYDANTNTATCTPTALLSSNTSYTMSLSAGIKDKQGNALAATTVSFSTGSLVISAGASFITSRTGTLSIYAPANATQMMIAETSAFTGASWVAVTTTTNFTFSADGTNTLYIKFKDTNGNVGVSHSMSILVDTVVPTVSSSTPANGTTGVSRASTIKVTFSETMDATTITSGTMTLNNGAVCTVTYNAATNAATCTPTASLAWGTVYTLSLSSAIKDSHGLFLATTTLNFTTKIIVSKIAAGSDSTTVRKSDGTLFAWGDNVSGQLGDGTTVQKTTPTKIGTATDWVSVACLLHTVALKSDGTLWAWGYNLYGRLGDGTTVDKLIPTQIGNTAWTAIAAGYDHTIAIKSDGTLWAWGYNLNGQLGDGTTVDKLIPTQIGVSTNWVSIAGGATHTVALRSDGTLWTWGGNFNGQLGDGTIVDKWIPTQIGVATNWIAISSGAWHIVALRSDGTLWTWGNNGAGQLGDGTIVDKWIPTQIGNATWIVIGAGPMHTVAVKSDGSLWTWGLNYSGQLGDGTTVDKDTPTLIIP